MQVILVLIVVLLIFIWFIKFAAEISEKGISKSGQIKQNDLYG